MRLFQSKTRAARRGTTFNLFTFILITVASAAQAKAVQDAPVSIFCDILIIANDSICRWCRGLSQQGSATGNGQLETKQKTLEKRFTFAHTVASSARAKAAQDVPISESCGILNVMNISNRPDCARDSVSAAGVGSSPLESTQTWRRFTCGFSRFPRR